MVGLLPTVSEPDHHQAQEMKNIYNDVRHGTERNILIAVRSHGECLKRLRMVVYFEKPIEHRLSTLWDPFTMLSIAKGQAINDLREPLASIVFTMTGSTFFRGVSGI